ncbi:MAG: hypothetical protein H7A51_13890 [Akkermansiaceae bacterium]|nr:hypothetical protein [Akkermansiaceae bacterium]
MKTRYLTLMSVLLVLSACRDAEEEPVLEKEGAIELLDRGKYWSYRTSDMFADGGSVIMGFINGNGEIIYVWFDFSIGGEKYDYRRCFLQESYNDPDAVEILQGSDLESKVITLIEESRSHEALDKIMPSRDKAIQILKSRDLNIRLFEEARSITPRKRIPIQRLPVAP